MAYDFEAIEAARATQPHRRRDDEGAGGPSDAAGAIHHLQRSAGNAAVGSLMESEQERSPVKNVIEGGGGSSLPDGVRENMEASFGTDFSDVRVHSDGEADASAKSVGAHAYTVGSNVVFRRDKYDPSSSEGQRMLAHELTHVIQQRQGPVDGTPAPGGIQVSDPSDRFEREADHVADQVMSGSSAPTGPAATPSAQRQEAPDDALQGSFVQRQAAEEEPEEGLQGSFMQRQAVEEELPEEETAGA